MVDDQSVLHLAFINSKTSQLNPAGIYYRQSVIGGGSWRKLIKLYESEYYRSSKANEASISIAAESTQVSSPAAQRIYVTWDNRPQKRVFLANSVDGGSNWGEAKQIKGPQETGGIATPFNLQVAAVENKVLLLWQEGEAGSEKCSILSQWSGDGGQSWRDTVTVFGASILCPSEAKLLHLDKNHIAAILTGQDDPILLAWDMQQWSEPQTQTRLPVFLSPETFEPILLGCRFDLISQNHLYTTGCDEGPGGDIWFLSRPLPPVDDWFSASTLWDTPDAILQETQTDEISNLSSVTDQDGNMHVVWVQSAYDSIALEYTRWNHQAWIEPNAIFFSFHTTPVDISIAADKQGRLLLTWVDGSSGELFFTWTTLERANVASEWRAPVALPSVSNLNSSPDILVDGAGRIVVVYAVSINEQRGIYVVQSTDSGSSWSTPVQVFDAASEGWERVESPKIALSMDGVLHLTFIRKSARAGQPVGLYYSRSADGGSTWSNSQILNEGAIQWSDIVSYDQHNLQVVWQEYNGLVAANLAQVSADGGLSWGRPISITGVSDSPTAVALASNGSERLHFMQLLRDSNDVTLKQDQFILQDWNWTGSAWELATESKMTIMGDVTKHSLTTGLTSDGFLGVSIWTEHSISGNELRNDIQILNRFLGLSNSSKESEPVVLPTPVALSSGTAVPTILPTQVVDPNVLYEENVSTTPMQRNIVGMGIIGGAVIVTALLLFRRRPASSKK
jgi:hypothetical protein